MLDVIRTFRRDGHLFVTDGHRTYPVPAGASPDGDGDGGDGGGDGGGGDDGGKGGDDDPLKDVGEKGKRAIEAERKTARDALRAKTAAEKRAQELEAELAKHREASQTEQEKALEKARKEASDEAAKTERERWSQRILESEVKSAAVGKLANPDRAVQLLDLAQFTVGDDLTVDTAEITKAIDELLESDPYLKAGATPAVPGRPTGSIDQGAHRDGDRPVAERVKDRLDRVKARTGIR